jgi:hypothetical protein
MENSLPEMKTGKALLVAHDAGGAELVARHFSDQIQSVVCAPAGPARAIFERHLGAFLEVALDESWDGVSVVISGTGWDSDHEFQCMRRAQKEGIPVVAVLDHWVRYQDRFERDGQRLLPDRIWVFDAEAEVLAKEVFPAVPVQRFENPYLTAEARKVKSLRTTNTPRAFPPREILYLMEPVIDDWDTAEGRQAERQTLEIFLTWLKGADPAWKKMHIVLRPHPSQGIHWAHELAAEFSQYNIEAHGGESLAQEMARADWVVGLESTALVLALEAGIPAATALPPQAPPCRLPHQGIADLREVEDFSALAAIAAITASTNEVVQ